MLSRILFIAAIECFLLALAMALLASVNTVGRVQRRGRARPDDEARPRPTSGRTLTAWGVRFRRLSLLAGGLAILLMLAARWTR